MKVELERDNLFFASFCPCFVVMQVNKYKNGGYVWVRDIDEHIFTQSQSASGVYPVLLACIIVTFHIDCHYFFIWIL